MLLRHERECGCSNPRPKRPSDLVALPFDLGHIESGRACHNVVNRLVPVWAGAPSHAPAVRRGCASESAHSRTGQKGPAPQGLSLRVVLRPGWVRFFYGCVRKNVPVFLMVRPTGAPFCPTWPNARAWANRVAARRSAGTGSACYAKTMVLLPSMNTRSSR